MRRALSLFLLLALASCAKSGSRKDKDSDVTVSAHTYPSDTKAAGWDKPNELFPKSVLELIPEINRRQEAEFAKNGESTAVPLSELQSSESLSPNVLSPERTMLDRAQDRDENESINMIDNSEEVGTSEHYLGTPKRTSPGKPTPKLGKSTKDAAPAPPPGNTWESLLPPAMTRGIDYGTSIGGPKPYARQDSGVFIPASIVKAVSVSRGLEILGPDYRFETRFSWHDLGGGVATQFTVTGNGDPTIGSSDFGDGDLRNLKSIIRQIKASGVSEVRGSIRMLSADARWDKTVHAPGVESKDYLACYGALSQTFNVANNCSVLEIKSATAADWSMPEINVPITMNLTTGNATAISVRPVIAEDGHVKGYSVHGTWGKSRKAPAVVRLPVPDSKTRFRNIVARELIAAGIVHKPNEDQGGGTQKHLIMYSPKLSEIIVPLLKESDNFLADAVFKRAGVEWADTSIPLREAAQLQLAKGIEQWTNKAGFAHMKDELLLLDGAGLSRANRATPRVYLTLMKTFASKSFFSALWNGLPIAGIDGTLISRLKSSKTRGMLRAKTGTVRGAYQLTGYMPDYNADASMKEYVPFVILTSTAPGNGHRVYAIQERLLVRLAEIVNPSFSPPRIPMP